MRRVLVGVSALGGLLLLGPRTATATSCSCGPPAQSSGLVFDVEGRSSGGGTTLDLHVERVHAGASYPAQLQLIVPSGCGELVLGRRYRVVAAPYGLFQHCATSITALADDPQTTSVPVSVPNGRFSDEASLRGRRDPLPPGVLLVVATLAGAALVLAVRLFRRPARTGDAVEA